MVKVLIDCSFICYIEHFIDRRCAVGGSFGPSFIMAKITLIMFGFFKACSTWEPLGDLPFT